MYMYIRGRAYRLQECLRRGSGLSEGGRESARGGAGARVGSGIELCL